MAYGVDAPRAIAAAAGSPIIPPAAGIPVAGADNEKDDDPLCHKTQMVLLLDSQKQDGDFISATAMTSMLTHIEGLKDHILKMVEKSASPHLHESMKDVPEMPVSRFTGGSQRPGKFHCAQKLTEIPSQPAG